MICAPATPVCIVKAMTTAKPDLSVKPRTSAPGIVLHRPNR
jgi:hypothetical protein